MFSKGYRKQKAAVIISIMAGMLMISATGINETLAQSSNIAQLVEPESGAVEESQSEEGVLKSGICEDGLEWIFTSDGTLTIRGAGPMQDYMFRGDTDIVGLVTAPWGELICEGNRITRIVVEEGVTRIGNNAFSITSVESASIAGSVTEIGDNAFGAYMFIPMSLKDVELNEGLEMIGSSAFAGCELSEIKIPSTVTSIGDSAFAGCKLSEIKIPAAVTSIGGGAFAGCELSEITIPSTVTSIGDRAFANCEHLTDVELNEGLERIGGGVFSGCPAIKRLMIPSSVVSLEEKMVKTQIYGDGEVNYYLNSSDTLENIEVDEDNPVYSSIDGIVYSKDGATLICYPSGRQAESFSIPSNVKNINGGAFAECEYLKNIKIPNGVEHVGEYAFYRCYTNLKEIEFPESVSSVGRSALDGCGHLEKVIIRNSRCDIHDSEGTLCNPLWETNVIYGYSGSTAEAHAQKYGHKFVALNGNGQAARPALQLIRSATPDIKLSVGAEKTLKVTGAKTKVTFSSSDSKIVTVGRDNGRIRALQPGTVTVTAKAAPTAKYKAASVTIKIKVVPRAAVISSLRSVKKGQVTVKSTAATKGYTGYQIQYKIGSGKTHTITKKSSKALTYTLNFKKANSGKKIKIRIRAYKKVNGVSYFGGYSKWKTLKKIK